MKGIQPTPQCLAKSSGLSNSGLKRKTHVPRIMIVLLIFIVISLIAMVTLYFKWSGYEKDYWAAEIGDKVYISEVYLGVIVATSSNHKFPNGTIRDAVNVDFGGGRTEWIAKDKAKQIFVIRNNDLALSSELE